jgi:hypothetical protein
MLKLMRPFARRMYAKMLAGWPEPLRDRLIEAHLLMIRPVARGSVVTRRDRSGRGGHCASSPASSSSDYPPAALRPEYAGGRFRAQMPVNGQVRMLV